MSTPPQECARTILDVTPIVIQVIRVEMRSQRLADLSVPQFRTLNFIKRHPGASLSAAAEFIGLTLSSMSILVNGLVERGLIEREINSEDRRRIHLTLTAIGRRHLEAAVGGAEARLAEMVAGLTDAERATVVDALELLRPIFTPRAAPAPAALAAPAALPAGSAPPAPVVEADAP